MKTLVFDLDGTMYRGTQIIESAHQFLDYCIQMDIPFIFLTNNSMRTPQENVKHMEEMGYTNIKPEMFLIVPWQLANMLRNIMKGIKLITLENKA